MRTPSPNASARIEHTLALRILRGEPAPGDCLPPVRTLAVEFGVTAPTIQRVVARLEGRGLVQAVHGSGVVVLDPRRHAGLAVLPLWFEAHAAEAAAGAKMLADVLSVRRGIAAQVIPQHRHALLAAAPALLERLDLPPAGSDSLARAEADLAATRMVLDICGNAAAVAIFNTVEQLVRTVPHVAEALYGDAEAHAANWADVLEALTLVDDPVACGARLEAALAGTDVAAVARFEALLAAERDGATTTGIPTPVPTPERPGPRPQP